MHHNTDRVPNLSQGSTDISTHLAKNLTIPVKCNTNQDNPLHTNNITQDVIQHYPYTIIQIPKVKLIVQPPPCWLL